MCEFPHIKPFSASGQVSYSVTQFWPLFSDMHEIAQVKEL